MGLALDEPGEEDETVTHNGVTYMMGQDVDRFLPPGAQLAIDLDGYRGGVYVRVVGQRDC